MVYVVNDTSNGGEPGSSRDQHTDHEPTISDTSPIINQPSRNCLPHTSTDPPTDDLEGSQHWLADSDSSLDETDIDFMDDANKEKDVYRYACTAR